jgi:dihydroneopterin aldolase
MDVIFISELRIKARIGVYEREKHVTQAIQLDVEVGLPARRAAAARQLDDTIDYARVVAHIERLFRDGHFPLLENAAETVAGAVQREFGAPWVRVSIAKLAPLRNVKRLGVTIERGKRPGGRVNGEG